jgi:acyl-coenzyme A synthetase/AMP-(fatty) acid ligase
MIDELVRWSEANKVALLTEDGLTVTYSQLHADALGLAQHLPARRLVFLLGLNDRATLTAYLACLASGAVPLLLNQAMSAPALAKLCQVYEPEYVFACADRLTWIGQFDARLAFEGYTLFQRSGASHEMLHPALALLLATSGTTGSPKLVRLSRHNLFANASSIISYLNIGTSDRAITSLPFNYSYGLSIINSHLSAGASISLTNKSFFDAAFWMQLKSHTVTSLAGVPYSYEILLKLRLERMDLPSVHTMTQAGGSLALPAAARVQAICRSKGQRFFTMYGQTEATARIAYLPPEAFEAKAGSIGRVIPGGELWLEDDAGKRIEAAGRVGELVYRGENVALGYAECRADLERGDVWGGILRTGDLARQDEDGFFFIEGRRHRFLKIFGVRISLDAVEAWFAQRSMVAAAYGDDNVLWVALQAEPALDTMALVIQLSADLTIHTSALKLRAVMELPRLTSGKVNYSCLKTML